MANLADRLSSTPRRPPEPARGSALRAVGFLGLALLGALGAGLLFSRYLDRHSAKTIPTARVVIAAADIPVATALRPELLTSVDWPKAALPAGAAADPATLLGKVTISAIVKGEPILPARLASGDLGQGLSAILPASMRAVAVRVDDVVGVAGFIHPGDHVDVIVTMKAREDSNTPPTSKVILQNVKVLSVGKELDRKTKQLDKAVPVTVATLMVSSPDSERLALAAAKGQILLSLRGGADTEEVETAGIIPPILLEGAPAAEPPAPRREAEARPAVASTPRPAVRRAVARPRPAERPAEPASQTVEILRGDRFEKRDFPSSEAQR